MKMPYIRFIIGMLDAPAIDYQDSKEDRTQVKKTKTAAEEIAAFSQFL
jgi:hypothetical protein